MKYPKMANVRQKLCSRPVGDVAVAVKKALQGLELGVTTKPGATVAVGVGSRGISRISQIVHETVAFLKAQGLKPFIVPAMGSHGGNTPLGQISVLAKLGMTESAMEVPIRASDEVLAIGKFGVGTPLFMDTGAAEADHLVVVNRIKPHTKFHGPIESGLSKMLTIGLGRGEGASEFHRAAVQHSFSIIQDGARHILDKRSVLFGLAVIEDGYKNVAHIQAVRPQNWFEEEERLLETARSTMPGIPFDPIDILIVDKIGKDISGIGMDSNVTGRHRDLVGDFFAPPHVKRIFVRDLTRGTDGNGNGIGLADVTTQRLVDTLDLDKTYTNAITAISLEKAAIPVHFPTDRQCMDVCLKTIGMISPEQARIVRIKNTSALDRLVVSRPLESQVAANPNLTMDSPWETITWDEKGDFSQAMP